MEELVGKLIKNRYQVRKFIGRGGMAEVYQVWDNKRSVNLALKMLHGEISHDQIFLRRFQREAQTVASLNHSNIVTIYEVQEHDGALYFSMEYLPAGSLKEKLQERPLPPREAAMCVQQVAKAIQYAHERGILHRDLKPANVLLDGRRSPILG